MTEVAVAIQGEAGSFSHAAALQALGPDIRLVPCSSFEELFRAVRGGRRRTGSGFPSRTRSPGRCTRTTISWRARAPRRGGDAGPRASLPHRPPRHRAGCDPPGGSHPVALAQCRRFFATHPDVVPVPAYDTAGSVRDLMAGPSRGRRRIASSSPPSCMGPRSSRRASRTTPRTTTRFLVVAREPAPPALARKTSLVFTLPNVPAPSIARLGVFRRARTRPDEDRVPPAARAALGVRVLSGCRGGSAGGVAEALAELRRPGRDLRILGAYPGSDIPAANG